MDFKRKLYRIDNWLPMHITQLAYFRNLLIVLSVAILGFTVSSYLGGSLNIEDEIIIKTVCVFYLISISCGVYIAFYESENYKIKFKISRDVERGNLISWTKISVLVLKDAINM